MTEDRILSHIARVNAQLQPETMQRLVDSAREAGADEGLFVWEAEISNDLLDSHYTHMSESTLRNYAEDANKGVAFLKGHDRHSLPLGYSLSGEMQTVGDKKRVVAGFYTDTGIPDAADLVRRMKVGILRDVSVGFHGGEILCDICGAEFWDCRHFPGLKYEEKKGDTVSTLLATFTVEGARLSEVSGVFDGSTPDAMILKAQRHAASGLLTPEQVNILEGRYRVSLPTRSSHPVPEIPKEKNMEELEQVRSKLNLKEDETVVQAFEKLQQRVAELEPAAKDGQQYRSDLVEEALAEGVRAQGEDFDSETYEETLRNAPIKVIKRMRDDWKKTADAVLPSGRMTKEEQGQKKTATVTHPDSAYA